MPETAAHWTVRRALPDDAPACVAIYRDWISRTDWMPMLHDAASMLRFWSRRFGVAEAWVALDGMDIVGFALRDGDSLDALYLSRESRRQGLGGTLLRCAQKDRTHLSLWAFEDNLPAIRFYAAQGFVMVGRTSGDNEEGLPDVQMRWSSDGSMKTSGL